MFYPKSKEQFTDLQFQNPSKNYRAAPFWAWNTKLDINELKRQIEIFKEMGFGGFHIHSRTGMATPYLSEEYFSIVDECVKKAKEEELFAYLYDEDRWPSGTAGGFVTKNEKFRQIYLRFQKNKIEQIGATLVACYDIIFNENKKVEYRKIDENETLEGTKWYAYVETEPIGNAWFNNQCYVDMLNPEAIKEFINLTHVQYKKHFKNEFENTIPSIFTDEPQLTRKNLYDNIDDNYMIPWTSKFEEIYFNTYKENIFNKLPEIFFETSNQEVSTTRYNYHELTTEMFASAFSDQYGKWCKENSLPMTGHMMCEGTLISQTLAVGDAMRHYRGFTMPGIDMLINMHEFTTAKQAQSMQRQKGAEGVLSELDGVTNWNFDFRGHKLHGDWQAALGVTLRVPHLSWVSMNGEAKRDYPASINYQSPWYKKYNLIENYFARINSVLTRGKSVCKVAVLHPIRNAWIAFGDYKQTNERMNKIDNEFVKLTEVLVKNHVDFDFVSESNLSNQNAHFEKGKFIVENCSYDILIIPEMISLKKSTLDIIKSSKTNSSRVVAFGKTPEYVDAVLSSEPKEIYKEIEILPYDINNIINIIDEYRDFEIIENNLRSNLYCGQLKDDETNKWLFIAKAVDPDITESDVHHLTIKIKGTYIPTEYCCYNGAVYITEYFHNEGFTIVNLPVFAQDSILLKLSENNDTSAINKPIIFNSNTKEINSSVKYALSEENVFLLDMAEFKLDNGEFEPKEEILKKDNELRKKLGFVQRGESIAQPWVNLDAYEPEHDITLRFKFSSKIEYKNAFIAIEDSQKCKITFNDKPISNDIKGWYVDKCIEKLSLGTIIKGENVLTVKMPFGETTNTEYIYILGLFGVFNANNPYIDKLPELIEFSDISQQGLLFYGGNIDYQIGDINKEHLTVPYYKGGLLEVFSEGSSIGEIICSPYTIDIKNKKDLSIRLYGTRINTFGQLHLVPHEKYNWFGPFSWRTEGREWTYDYLPWEQGILQNPITD